MDKNLYLENIQHNIDFREGKGVVSGDWVFSPAINKLLARENLDRIALQNVLSKMQSCKRICCLDHKHDLGFFNIYDVECVWHIKHVPIPNQNRPKLGVLLREINLCVMTITEFLAQK